MEKRYVEVRILVVILQVLAFVQFAGFALFGGYWLAKEGPTYEIAQGIAILLVGAINVFMFLGAAALLRMFLDASATLGTMQQLTRDIRTHLVELHEIQQTAHATAVPAASPQPPVANEHLPR